MNILRILIVLTMIPFKSACIQGVDNSSHSNLDLSTVLSSLPAIQESLKEINARLGGVEQTVSSVAEIKGDLYSQDGIEHRLRFVSQQSENATAEIDILRDQNYYLRNELLLLRSVVMKMDGRMTNMQKEITDLKRRSMRDNILIHNFQSSPSENLAVDIPSAIKRHLDLDIKFVRIHRNGPQKKSDKKPVSITAKLVYREDKDKLLDAQRDAKKRKIRLPFSITSQEPIPLVEERKRLFDISDSFRNQGKSTKVFKGKIVLPNGETYQDEVPKLSCADILKSLSSGNADITSYETRSSSAVTENVTLKAIGSNVTCKEEVSTLYRNANLDPDCASANHNILVYRFKDDSGLVHESYHDDGDFGSGRRLLGFMRENKILNRAFVISMWTDGKFPDYSRFQKMQNLIIDITNELDNDKDEYIDCDTDDSDENEQS